MSSAVRMRVVHLGPGLEVRGGVSAVERLILQRLAERVDIHHIATMEEGSLWRKLKVFVRALRALRRELRHSGTLLVHIHFASRGSALRKWIAARMTLAARRPLILHAHGASFDRFFAGLPRPLQGMVRRVVRRADRLIVLSSQWQTFYLQRCAAVPERMAVLHNPVSLPASVPDRSQRGLVRFVFLGRIGARKGAFDLLEAFGALPPGLRERARLVFAGDGEVDELRRQAAQLDSRIAVLSWIDVTAREALLRDSDVFVLPSHSEGLPMAMLEAMAHGLAVIVTPVGGIPDVIEDGREGVLVPAGSVVRLRGALQSLIENGERRVAMGRRARDSARKFDVETYAQELMKLYAGLWCQPAAAPPRSARASGLRIDRIEEY